MKKSNICRLPTEVTSCAIRGRSDGEWHESDHEQRLEIGDNISHSITSVAKDSYVFEPCILRMERTEEEKRRRHLYGDKGAKFRKGKQYEPMTDGCSRTITTFCLDNILMEKNEKTRVFDEINEDNTREVLRLLREEVGEEKIQRAIGRLRSFLEEKVLQSGLYEEGVCSEGGEQSGILPGAPFGKKDSISSGESSESMRDLRFNEECGCSPQGREFQEQLKRELDACLQELSSENPSTKNYVSYLWDACNGGINSLQQTLLEIQEIWQSIDKKPQARFRYRIRKLTPRECLRLMAARDSDIDKMIAAGISESQLYKLAGNSIVVDCLVNGIFKNLFIESDKPQLTLF